MSWNYAHGKVLGQRHGAWLWRRKWWLAGLAGGVAALALIPVLYAVETTHGLRFSQVRDLPPRRVAIVFGAGVDPHTGLPTPYLEKRLQTAAMLYKTGKV